MNVSRSIRSILSESSRFAIGSNVVGHCGKTGTPRVLTHRVLKKSLQALGVP